MEPGTPAIAVYEFYATLLKASSDPSPFVSILIEAWKNKDGRIQATSMLPLTNLF